MMQPPESPIPDSFWRKVFNVSLVASSAVMMWSLWRSSNAAQSGIAAQLKVLHTKKSTEDEVEAALEEMNRILDSEIRSKQGCSRLALIDETKMLLSHLRTERENTNIVSALLHIIRRCVGGDPDARVAFNHAGGCKRVMIVLVQAFNEGKTKLVEDAAHALKELTAIDDDDIVMAYDVPKGAEGTLQLSKLPVCKHMLRNVDHPSTLQMLIGTVGIYANICTLRKGAHAVQHGVDGRSGLSYFLPLIDATNNVLVVEQALRCVRWLVYHCPNSHAELAQKENVDRLMSVMQLNRDKRSLTHLMHIVYNMQAAPQSHQVFVSFFNFFLNGAGGNGIFEIFTRHSDQLVREQAALLVIAFMEKTQTAEAYMFADRMKKLMEQYRKAIAERRAADEQAKRAAQQQQQQQQMMMMQMMQGGMGGMGGGDMDMGDEEEE